LGGWEWYEVKNMSINNEIYENLGDTWWDDNGDSNLVSLRFLNNPVKFNYIKNVIYQKQKSHIGNGSILDVGCGGGYLSEELAKIGLKVTGIGLRVAGRSLIC
jgi:2-polyprenyl-6-hydroxyphenyl methylase/3-demethylubiquinone-9 3-methyltransferase